MLVEYVDVVVNHKWDGVDINSGHTVEFIHPKTGVKVHVDAELESREFSSAFEAVTAAREWLKSQ